MDLPYVKTDATSVAERGELGPLARRRPRGRRWRPVIAAVLLALAASSPARAQAPPDSVTLTWTDTGDDGTVGTAATIDLRRSPTPITSANWGQATSVPGVQAPGASGTAEAFVVRGLSYGTTYYFAMRVSDEAGNWSGLSNVAVWSWSSDTTPPAVPQGLTATVQGGTVRLAWAGDVEPDLAGYNIYRSTSAGGPFAHVNTAVETGTSYDDTPANGTSWYQVTALDQSGNESAASSSVSVTFSTTLAISMSPGYPNPSKSSEPVRIPVLLSMSGAGTWLDIMDAAGRIVRHIDLGSLGAGNQEITWDGKNDAGRVVAPGTYTAVLSGHGLSGVERLVRLP